MNAITAKRIVPSVTVSLLLIWAGPTVAQLPDGSFTDLQPVANVNDPTLTDLSPRISENGLELFFTRWTTDPEPNLRDIFVARRDSTNQDFGPAEKVPLPVSSGSPDGMGSISADGRTIYFDSGRPGAHFSDIFRATRSGMNEPFTNAENFPELQVDFDERYPFISWDGSTIYYSSFDTDINFEKLYQASRTAEGSFENVLPLEIVGFQPTVSRDGLALFFGNFDATRNLEIYFATRETTDDLFQGVTKMARPINSGHLESGFVVSPDWPVAGSTAYFESSRGGNRDIWQATWVPESSPGDMNGDGLTNFADLAPFVLGLTDIPAYESAYPHYDRLLAGDINTDGAFDLGDLTPFAELLTSVTASGSAVPEPAAWLLLWAGATGMTVLRRRD